MKKVLNILKPSAVVLLGTLILVAPSARALPAPAGDVRMPAVTEPRADASHEPIQIAGRLSKSFNGASGSSSRSTTTPPKRTDKGTTTPPGTSGRSDGKPRSPKPTI